MPIYEYRCRHCGEIIDVLVSETAPNINYLPVCTNCGHLTERKLSSFNNHFTPTKSKE
jgi:putative FmdB family regulatory protein